MKAVVSGRAGVALVLDGERVAALRKGAGSALTPCRLEDFPLLFGDAGDLQFLEDLDPPQIAERLAEEADKELALQVALILLDGGFSSETRRSAAQELEVLLDREATVSFLKSVLYARPLPQSTSRSDALEHVPEGAKRLRSLLESLWKLQPHIAEVDRAWRAIPARYFSDEEQRARLQTAAVRKGVFRELVTLLSQRRLEVRANVDRWEGLLGYSSQTGDQRSLVREWLAILDPKSDASVTPAPVGDQPQREAAADDPVARRTDFQERLGRARRAFAAFLTLKPYGDNLCTLKADVWLLLLRSSVLLIAGCEAVAWGYIGYLLAGGTHPWMTALLIGGSVGCLIAGLDTTFVMVDMSKLRQKPRVDTPGRTTLLSTIVSSLTRWSTKAHMGALVRIVMVAVSLSISAPFLAQLLFSQEIAAKLGPTLNQDGIVARFEALRELNEIPGFAWTENAFRLLFAGYFLSLLTFKWYEPRELQIYFNEELQGAYRDFVAGRHDAWWGDSAAKRDQLSPFQFAQWYYGSAKLWESSTALKARLAAITARQNSFESAASQLSEEPESWMPELQRRQSEVLAELGPLRTALSHERDHASRITVEIVNCEDELAHFSDALRSAAGALDVASLIEKKSYWEDRLRQLKESQVSRQHVFDQMSQLYASKEAELRELERIIHAVGTAQAELAEKILNSRRNAVHTGAGESVETRPKR